MIVETIAKDFAFKPPKGMHETTTAVIFPHMWATEADTTQELPHDLEQEEILRLLDEGILEIGYVSERTQKHHVVRVTSNLEYVPAIKQPRPGEKFVSTQMTKRGRELEIRAYDMKKQKWISFQYDMVHSIKRNSRGFGFLSPMEIAKQNSRGVKNVKKSLFSLDGELQLPSDMSRPPSSSSQARERPSSSASSQQLKSSAPANNTQWAVDATAFRPVWT